MDGERATTRRLVAVLAADVVGYSRMMETDEDATMKAWWSHREEIIDPNIAEHRGRMVKHTGDGFLAEFPSALDAVSSAMEMQGKLALRNKGLAADRHMDFRVGINICDILADDEDIYGDGVNIAARLEGLAEPGGICISGDVYRQVKNKLDLEYREMGEQKVKNIAERVLVYLIAPGTGDGGLLGRLQSTKGSSRRSRRQRKRQEREDRRRISERTAPTMVLAMPERRRATALVLCLLLGLFGAHKFYVGRMWSGIFMVLTVGGAGLWMLFDLVMIITGEFSDHRGRPLARWW